MRKKSRKETLLQKLRTDCAPPSIVSKSLNRKKLFENRATTRVLEHGFAV
jgi:hypothetical protein